MRPLGRLYNAGTLFNSMGTGGRGLRTLGRFAIVLVTHGGGRYRDALGIRSVIAAGALIVVFPEVPHVYGPERGGSWDEIYLTFDGPFFEEWRTAGWLNPQFPVHRVEKWNDEYAALLNFCQRPRPLSEPEHLEQLAAFMSIMARLVPWPAQDERQPHWLAVARGALEANLGSPLSGKDAAEAAGMSYGAFRKAFAQATGQSPGQYRMAMRVAAARTLLRTTQLTNAAIAQGLGFTDEFHFSKRFAALQGEPPRSYRRRMQQQAEVELRPEGIEPPTKGL